MKICTIGVIFPGTGKNVTLVAVNATDGKMIWQTIPVDDPNRNYITQGPPTVWKDIVLIGQAIYDYYYILFSLSHEHYRTICFF